MHITWLGQACFKIQGQSVTIITDPFGPEVGIKMPKVAADIVTVSNAGDSNLEVIKGINGVEPFIINSPGEYEIKDALIYGIDSQPENDKKANAAILYRIKFEGLTIAHLGNLGHLIGNGQLEQLEGIDILFIPVGGEDVLDSKKASELISQIEPRMVIPMHYKIPGIKTKAATLDSFCKEIGVCPTEELQKLKIFKKDLPAGEMKVVTLAKI